MKNRLKVLRAERDWSQADLAERLEVSRQSVNAIETGKFDPSLPLAFRLARSLKPPSRRSSRMRFEVGIPGFRIETWNGPLANIVDRLRWILLYSLSSS
jgi:putative transcriptional regulator